MKRNIQRATLLVLVFISFCHGDAQSLKDALQPAIKNGGFKREGYILWCPTVIKVGNTYHLFASSWPEQYGLSGWTKYSEIIRATSDNLFGPYQFREVVIQKKRRILG